MVYCTEISHLHYQQLSDTPPSRERHDGLNDFPKATLQQTREHERADCTLRHQGDGGLYANAGRRRRRSGNSLGKKCSYGKEGRPVHATFSEQHRTRGCGRFARAFSTRSYSNVARYFIATLIMASIPGIDPSELSDIICQYLQYKDECTQQLEEAAKAFDGNGTYCEGEFDAYMCWNHSKPGQPAIAPCPSFYRDSNNTGMGYRFCHPNGSWFREKDEITGEMVIWRHIEECSPYDNDNATSETTDDMENKLLINFRTMYSIGYAVSLVCLVIALLLLAFFKKLHCTRNYIHMNLMVSFIIRYVVILIKDSVLVSHYTLDGLSDLHVKPYDKLQQYCDAYGGTGWVLTRCRLMITLMHYAITANYFWLLAEGLYLQMLLVFVMSENKYFAGFMVFGWGAPWISVIIWVVLRVKYENSGCWDMNDKLHVWWTIRAPIIISIVINFLIFVNIVRLIVSKLKANNMAHTDIKLRLAKSTLALIPLLGIHYIVFLALTEEVTDNTTPLHLKLVFDMFLTSIQGTLVSVLYCFLNGEVRTEVRKAWRDWRTRKELPRGGPNTRKSSTIHSGNQSTSVTYFTRHSTVGADCLLSEGNHCSPGSNRLDVVKTARSGLSSSLDTSVTRLDQSDAVNGGHTIEHEKKDLISYEHTNGNGKCDYATTTFLTRPSDVEANGNVDFHECVPCLQEQSV